jgi:hypothetical protein
VNTDIVDAVFYELPEEKKKKVHPPLPPEINTEDWTEVKRYANQGETTKLIWADEMDREEELENKRLADLAIAEAAAKVEASVKRKPRDPKLDALVEAIAAMTSKESGKFAVMETLDYAPNFEYKSFQVVSTTSRRHYKEPEVYVRPGYNFLSDEKIKYCDQQFPLAECSVATEIRVLDEQISERREVSFPFEDWRESWNSYLDIVFACVTGTRALSFEESVKTFLDDNLLEKASGDPFSVSCVCGKSHTNKGQVLQCLPALELLKKQFISVEAGEDPQVVFDAFCKEERIKLSKFNQGKTRLVFTNSILLELLIRSVYYEGVKNLHHHAETLPFKIGLNIHNGGLARLFSSLAEVAGCAMEGDFTNMDASQGETFMNFNLDTTDRILKVDRLFLPPFSFGVDPIRNRCKFVRKNICGAKFFRVGGKIVKQIGGGYNPSGHFLTGDLNSDGTLFYNFYLFHRVPPKSGQIMNYIKTCKIAVYGDDNTSGFSRVITESEAITAAADLGLVVGKDKVKITERKTLRPSEPEMVSGKSFLGQMGVYVNGDWAFTPTRPEKILVSFLRPTHKESMTPTGEFSSVLCVLANFCYDDVVKPKVFGEEISVFDNVRSAFCLANPDMVVPCRKSFKAARSGKESVADDIIMDFDPFYEGVVVTSNRGKSLNTDGKETIGNRGGLPPTTRHGVGGALSGSTELTAPSNQRVQCCDGPGLLPIKEDAGGQTIPALVSEGKGGESSGGDGKYPTGVVPTPGSSKPSPTQVGSGGSKSRTGRKFSRLRARIRELEGKAAGVNSSCKT